MSEGYRLKWSRGYSFQELLARNELSASFRKEYKSTAGVYVHRDHRPNKVAYVGKTSGSPDLWTRQFEHYVSLIGGRYVIPTSTGGLHDDQYDWIPGPDSRDVSKLFDKSLFKDVVDLAFAYCGKVTIHFCVLDSDRVAKAVERELIYALQPFDNDRGRKSVPAETLRIEHDYENFPELREYLQNDRANHIFL